MCVIFSDTERISVCNDHNRSSITTYNIININDVLNSINLPELNEYFIDKIEYINSLNLEYIIPRLIKENDFNNEFESKLAINEYKKFLVMILVYYNNNNDIEQLIPSKNVDKIWHKHILHTNKYKIDCNYLLNSNNIIHHDPSPNELSEYPTFHYPYYIKTKTLYNKIFGYNPPLSIWNIPADSDASIPDPTTSPSETPTITPSISPSLTPSVSPSMTPSLSPSESPSNSPSLTPTITPTLSPSISPSNTPTQTPSISPIDDIIEDNDEPDGDNVNDQDMDIDDNDNDDDDENVDDDEQDNDDDDDDDDDSGESEESDAKSITINSNNIEPSLLNDIKYFINNFWIYICLVFLLGMIMCCVFMFIIRLLYNHLSKKSSFKYKKIIQTDASSVTVSEISDVNIQ